MSKPKLTPWIDGSVKPTRVGVYERMSPGWYGKWDGRAWMRGDTRKRVAAASSLRSDYQNHHWRGLASDPAKGAK